MAKYLSGKRLQGTSAERTAVTPSSDPVVDTSTATPASWLTSPNTDDATTAKNANNRVGNKIETNNVLVGKTLTQVSFNIYVQSSYSGSNTASFKLWNSSGTERHNFGTFNISSLGTSAAKVTQDTAMGSGVTVAAGDYIGIENNNTDSDIKVKQNYNTGGESTSIPNAKQSSWNGSSFASDPDADVHMEARYESSSGNTVLKFTAVGSYTFTPSANFNVEYLVVGGGGGGGNENWADPRGSGGGGAGAYRTATGLSLTSGTEYTVTVGDGGIGGLQTGSGSCGTSYEPYLYQGTKGNDSVFGSITSNGGAGGGGHQGAGGGGCETSYGFLENGNASGSGGSNSRTNVAGNTSKGDYGNKGGGGGGSGSNYSGGGGGGAGSAGSNSSGGSGGAGGSGTASSITGSSVTYATGGGGHGGSSNGAGGNSSANNNAGATGGAGNSATSNTGSGGGANSGTSRAGKGGSGIVVLKFTTSGSTYSTSKSGLGSVQTNSILEESDTGKHYIWNATTSTWTEIG